MLSLYSLLIYHHVGSLIYII